MIDTHESRRQCIDRCNSLVRGEISAVETYDTALKRFGSESGAEVLREVRSEHAKSVEALRQNIVRMGGEPATESKGWGDFATTVTQAASLVGDKAALEALKQGERLGMKEYEKGIEDEATEEQTKLLYSEDLLPRLSSNLTRLEAVES